MSEKLYAVYGAGNDSVGLVGRISSSISAVGGNINDLRQDVLHGLFTIYLVADLSASDLQLETFTKVIRDIGEDTGLELHVTKYIPTPRDAERKNLLVILLGRDRAGIVAKVSNDLSAHRINIEFARMIAREGIFLMELLTDVSNCTLPLNNLETVVWRHMSAMGITSVFQAQDVFNPKKRVILFNLRNSLIAPETLRQVQELSGVDDLGCAAEGTTTSLAAAASRMDGLPLEVFNKIVAGTVVSPGTCELIQTLQLMGYRIALNSNAFTPVTEFLRETLGLDHAFGVGLPVDDDSQAIVGELNTPAQLTEGQIISQLMITEGIACEDICLVSDQPEDSGTVGIRMNFDMKTTLDYLHQRILNKESLAGILGSFGVPGQKG